jgi:hypothetical protein
MEVLMAMLEVGFQAAGAHAAGNQPDFLSGMNAGDENAPAVTYNANGAHQNCVDDFREAGGPHRPQTPPRLQTIP